MADPVPDPRPVPPPLRRGASKLSKPILAAVVAVTVALVLLAVFATRRTGADAFHTKSSDLTHLDLADKEVIEEFSRYVPLKLFEPSDRMLGGKGDKNAVVWMLQSEDKECWVMLSTQEKKPAARQLMVKFSKSIASGNEAEILRSALRCGFPDLDREEFERIFEKCRRAMEQKLRDPSVIAKGRAAAAFWSVDEFSAIIITTAGEGF